MIISLVSTIVSCYFSFCLFCVIYIPKPYPWGLVILPRVWFRYGDDTFLIQKTEHSLNCYNTSNPLTLTYNLLQKSTTHIYPYPFLGHMTTHFSLQSTGNVHTQTSTFIGRTTICYLLSIVINTLTHRARTVCVKSQLLHKEEEYIKGALLRCEYLNWALNRLKIKSSHTYNTTQTHNNTS